MLMFDAPRRRDTLSLQNWVKSNACISRKETVYLTHGNDLLTIHKLNNDAVRLVEGFLEITLIRFFKRFRKVTTLSLHLGLRYPLC